MELRGRSLIGSRDGEAGGERFQAIDPASGERLVPVYYSASADEVDEAARLADEAFSFYGRTSGQERARFLRLIAERIEALGEALITRAARETGLDENRLRNERARTCNQLRLFAALIEEGSWVDARIDHGDPRREPVPKPDVRSMLRPLGPVVVFGASNFPLAFSVAGGDTASALAAGNPVIVKAHPAHPGTSELVGRAVRDAVRQSNLHEGVFSLLYDAGNEVGLALVTHPLIKAGAFTGSRAAGLALMRAASARPVPIPFYAEMSSVNPFFILPEALRERGERIAQGLHASVTLGAGQFCTKPGLIFLEEGEDAERFIELFRELMSSTADFVLLTPRIRAMYDQAIAARLQKRGVDVLVGHPAPSDRSGCHACPALFRTDAATFLTDPELAHEVFGPAALIITYTHRSQLMEVARSLEGQLTATVHATENELSEYRELLFALEERAGRLIFNGFPTGVEVCHAMVHGGPFPATSDGRSTSVGTRAILRFTRPVSFQNFPSMALPPELQDGNPLGIWRMVDGVLTKDPC